MRSLEDGAAMRSEWQGGTKETEASTLALPCHVGPSACFGVAGSHTQTEWVLMSCPCSLSFRNCEPHTRPFFIKSPSLQFLSMNIKTIMVSV